MLDAPASGIVMPLTTITVSMRPPGDRCGRPGPDVGMGGGTGGGGRSGVVFGYEAVRNGVGRAQAEPPTPNEGGRTPGGRAAPRVGAGPARPVGIRKRGVR